MMKGFILRCLNAFPLWLTFAEDKWKQLALTQSFLGSSQAGTISLSLSFYNMSLSTLYYNYVSLLQRMY